ncbi:hypothetical Protein YC6258_02876 [Gynuella sunshinyii YC6258]|uniref:Uncharacterized protein n=1 Tax=Gynuella sunshinyii YC6258 TaxID=1445510 RepID=A0A0C5V631_9GAMM|nr:hypothetical Protein YC6258_02876 [Gynuella sunshinyii YC6258]
MVFDSGHSHFNPGQSGLQPGTAMKLHNRLPGQPDDICVWFN